MASFALITEGETDQAILGTLLCEFYDADLDINRIQPTDDATERSRTNFGGWEQMLNHCAQEDFEEILRFNDFVVFQIDTDVGEHKNFGVSLTSNGCDRPVMDIVNDVRTVITSKIDKNVLAKFKDRFLFAVAVHSLECWLLPLYTTIPAEAAKTKKCATTLEALMLRANLKYAKDYRSYLAIGKAFKKAKNIQLCREKSESLDIFLNSLPGSI